MQSVLQSIALFICYRLLPHPFNLTPLISISLFSGKIISDRKLAYFLPILCMLSSDFFLGFYTAMPFTYTAILLIVGLGRINLHYTLYSTFTNSLFSACLFFLISNFGVWCVGKLYAHTLTGLLACYTAAIPFFQNTLLGAIGFSLLIWLGLSIKQILLTAKPLPVR